jgi:hypothetical protein
MANGKNMKKEAKLYSSDKKRDMENMKLLLK